MKRLIAYSILTFSLLIQGVSAQNIKNEAEVSKMAHTSFANFTSNMLRTFGSGADAYKGYRTEDGDGYRYYWEQNLCMMATEDAAEYMLEPRCIALCDSLCSGFKKHYNGLGTSWNEYIDDLLWNGLSFIRGYRITGKAEYLSDAKTIWNALWERGNHGPGDQYENTVKDGSQGLWWRVKPDIHAEVKESDVVKSPLSNSPAVCMGCYLFEATGDEKYLNYARNVWQWEVDVLWIEGEGIAEGWYPDGHKGSRRTLHDLSTFFEGTNALWRCTHEQVYWDWCLKILDNILTKRLNANGIIQNAFGARDGSWCYEVARALTMFVYDNQLWDVTYTTAGFRHLPSGYTLYQWMANSAKEIRNDNKHMIILPTRKPDFVIEAEDAILEQGGNKEIKYVSGPQYSRDTKVTNLGNGNLVHFVYQADKAGTYTANFYYTSTANRRVPVLLNGNTSTARTFRSCTIATRPEVLQTTFDLRAGGNVITIGSGTAVDLDVLTIELQQAAQSAPIDVSDTTIIEGEAATKFYGTRRNGSPTLHAGAAYSGFGYVGNLGQGNYTEYTCSTKEAGTYTLVISYLPADEETVIKPILNNAAIDDIVCLKADTFVTTTQPVTIQLSSGSNTLRLANPDAALPCIDYIRLAKVDPTDVAAPSAPPVHPARTYDISGRRVSDTSNRAGIRITNGRKTYFMRR